MREADHVGDDRVDDEGCVRAVEHVVHQMRDLSAVGIGTVGAGDGRERSAPVLAVKQYDAGWGEEPACFWR